MSPNGNAPRRKRRLGPQYYRVPSFWGLVGVLIIVVLLIVFLSRLA
jgi:hypothetical protein